MKLNDFLRKEVQYIQERFNVIHNDAYSNSAVNYNSIVTHHFDEIQGYKTRLEEIMELSDHKDSFSICVIHLVK